MSQHTEPRTFPADGPVSLSVKQHSGDTVVTATDTTDVTVRLRPSGPNGTDLAERTAVDYRPGELRIEVPRSAGFIRSSSVDVLVAVPDGSSVDLEAGAGEVELNGQLDAVTVKTGSGDISADNCGDMRLRAGSGDIIVNSCASIVAQTGSGDIRLHLATGTADLHSGSGDIQVTGSFAQGRASAGSGDVSIGDAMGKVELKTASGDIDVRRAIEGDLSVKASSGDVSVGIATGTAARLDVSSASGSVRSELDETAAPAETDRKLFLAIHTASGSIKLGRTS